MTLLPVDYMILAVVVGKVLVALLFLRWLVTSPKRTGATDTHKRLREGVR